MQNDIGKEAMPGLCVGCNVVQTDTLGARLTL